MIYVYPVGGLGNMFFHIASIWALAKDNGDELCLLNFEQKIAELLNDHRCDVSHAAIYKYFLNRFPNVNKEIKLRMIYPFEYVPLVYKKEHEYLGYFQTEKYFKHRRKEILELFKSADEFNSKINEYAYLFNNISVHVRRNDYVRLYPEIHPPQTVEYYNKALSVLPKDMLVIFFSDDLKWCKENFVGDRYVFVDEIDYISIYVMMKMKHHIIANSSFSWWTAWMSEHVDKIVIAPQHWFGIKAPYYDGDIIPEDWIKM